MEIKQILEMCLQYGASDVHIMVGSPPTLRLHGNLVTVPESQVVTPEIANKLILPILGAEQKELVEIDKELDFSYSLPSGARFRVNVYHEKGNMAVAMRYVPEKILSIAELGLPEILADLTQLKQGLVLITGPTGHGKSTALAAMINKINLERAEHIVTIEDPIEFVHKPSKSIFSQRELNADTHSWGVALKSVLREDPNVVLIGEMRDYETIEAALTIAETGHLVFATLHTNNAPQTIDRIVDVFPQDQQGQVRSQLASVLEGVLSLRLIPSVEERRVPVVEGLLASSAVRSIIRDGKTHMLTNTMQTSGEAGMRTIEMALAESYKKKQITLETAREYAMNLEELNRLVAREG